MSIRWRLPLTYGLIALIAAVAMGAVLLVSLQRSYARRELQYLQRNGEAIGEIIEALAEPELDGLAAQIDTLAFLTQTRIRLSDSEGRLLVDSGDPKQQTGIPLTLRLEAGDIVQELEQFDGITSAVVIVNAQNQQLRSKLTEHGGDSVPALVSPFEFAASGDGRRSTVTWQQELTSFFGEDELLITLSDGPAIGRAVLGNVATTAAIAGVTAIAVATAIGAWISRRISEPLLALTATTQQMAQGSLTARSAITRSDEIGTLATSFNRMAQQIEQIVLALRRFVADAAHELQTPITALRTNLELAADAEDELPYLTEAQQQAQRLQRLTSQLLQLSRLESSSFEPAKATVDLSLLLSDWSEHYASIAEQAGIDLVVQLPPAATWVAADRQQLRQMVDNLVDNAIKFTPAGGVVRLSLRQRDVVELDVSDSGIGIDGDSSRLFERFYRGANSSSYPGSGLGLAIVAEIAAAHNGTVSAASNGNGTTVSIRLPPLSHSAGARRPSDR